MQSGEVPSCLNRYATPHLQSSIIYRKQKGRRVSNRMGVTPNNVLSRDLNSLYDPPEQLKDHREVKTFYIMIIL